MIVRAYGGGAVVTGGDRRRFRRWQWLGCARGGTPHQWVVVVVAGEHQNDGEVVSGGRWRRVVADPAEEGSG